MECLFIYISSERQNNIIYEELVKAADELKALNHKKPRPILKSLTLKPSDNIEEVFSDSEVSASTHDWEGQIPIIGCEFQQICDDFCSNDYFRLAEQLHKICDEELTVGRTNIHLIWCVDKYAPCPSEVPEFYGAVERLKLWHNCSFNVVTKNESNVADWSSVFSFQIVKSSEKIVTDAVHTIWTGRLGMKFESRNSLTEIGNVSLQMKPYANAISKFNNLSDSYILPVAELFDDIDLNSIPWPCIMPGSICQLKICYSNEPDEREELQSLFAKIKNRNGVGALLRIRHSIIPPTLIRPESVQTNSWKQTIAEGQFTTTPSLQFKGYHQCQVFLLISEGSTGNEIYAIGLQDINSIGEDAMKLAINESSNHSCNGSDEDEKNKENHIYGLLKETPELTPVHMAAMSHLLVQLPINLRSCLIKNGQNVNNLWTETREELEYLTNCEIFNHLFMSRPPMYVVRSPDTVFEPEVLAPKDNWPEYRALKKPKQHDLNISTQSQNILNAMPAIPEGAPVNFNANQLLKFFSKTGKPSSTVNEKMVKFSPKGKNRFTRIFQQFSEVKNTIWPDSLHSSYHGINYNTGDEEETFEKSCSKIKDQWIVEETTSTCSTFQKESISTWKKAQKRTRSVAEADQTSRSSRSGSSYYANSQIQKVPERILRRSPRKKVRQDTERSLLKASDLLKLEISGTERTRKTRTAVRKTVSTDLSELHARKLRNAVLTALEGETITVKSSIFKNCFKKLFAVCKPFVADVIGLGSTTRNMEKIAKSHVKQVIEFEKLKEK